MIRLKVRVISPGRFPQAGVLMGICRSRVTLLGLVALCGMAVLLAVLAFAGGAWAGPRESVGAVVGIRVEVASDARTAKTLGTERLGSGVVIDKSGLVLTIGYLVLEASGIEVTPQKGNPVPATLIAYDHESGLGLIRATTPLSVEPAPIGSSASVVTGDPLLVLSLAGSLDGLPVKLADRRRFAGYWEYLLDDALFTSPAHRAFGGAALLDREGALVGIGSLIVQDAVGEGIASPGNMFVPVDALKPIMADLLAFGKRDGPARPWLGLSVQSSPHGLIVVRVADGGPAEKAGLTPGDQILAVAGRKVRTIGELWDAIWAQGAAGVIVPFELSRRGSTQLLAISSIDRSRWLRWRQSY